LKKSAKAFSWSLIDTYANFGLKLVFTIAIARILSPSDYGIVAYTGLFIGIATFISEGGFTSALIHKEEPTQADYSTIFLYTLASSLFFFLLYFISAGWVASYFSEPALKNVLRVASLSFVVNSVGAVHMTQLIRSLEFKKQAKINFVSSTIGGIIGLSMAVWGFNYWALVAQTIVSTTFRFAGLVLSIRWIPSLMFSLASFRSLFNFGFKTFMQGLIESIFREIQAMVIGKNYFTRELGLYDRGKKFYDLLIIQTSIAINKVLFPLMSRNRSDQEAYREIYSRTYNILFFVMAPLSLTLFLISGPMVEILLTAKWMEVVPIMQLFFVGGGVFMLLYFNSTTMLASGKASLFLYLDLIQKTMLAISLFITYKMGIITIITGWLISYYLYYGIYEYVMFRQGYHTREKYLLMGQVLLALIPLLVINYSLMQVSGNPWFLLFSQCMIFPLAYLASLKISRSGMYRLFAAEVRQHLGEKYRRYV